MGPRKKTGGSHVRDEIDMESEETKKKQGQRVDEVMRDTVETRGSQEHVKTEDATETTREQARRDSAPSRLVAPVTKTSCNNARGKTISVDKIGCRRCKLALWRTVDDFKRDSMP